MSLNTWLSAAKRHILNSSTTGKSVRRRHGVARQRSADVEQLESRALLTALVINNSNVDDFVNATTGALEVTNTDLGAHDSLVIERVTLGSPDEAISIDLTGVNLEHLAIETVSISSFTGTAIDVNLTNVTGLRTIAIEDVRADSADSGDLGVRLNLVNTDVYAVTIEDSSLAGIVVDANMGSDITHGVITENQVSAPAGRDGILLNVESGGRADNFHIINNFDVSALDRDAIRLNLTDSPTDGLVIDNNTVGNEPGANVFFRAEGDTFVQPFRLRNDASDGELLQQFVLDLRPLGLVFDVNPATGRPFTAVDNAAGVDTGTLTGISGSTLSSNNQVLTVDFTDFAPGETLLFNIDVDNAPLVPGDPPQDFSAFGRDLIGAEVTFDFAAGNNSGPKQVRGLMVGDADVFNASEFARGDTVASDVHGINLNLVNSPVTNARISNNTVTGVAGHGVRVNSSMQSDVSAVIRDNVIRSGGQDGIRFDLLDSNFTGAIVDNAVGANAGNGVAFIPQVSRRGLVEAAVDGNPVVITSTNHQLQTGDQIIMQGMVNDDPTVNHPGNGLRTVTRIDNNRFSLNGVSGLPANVVYAGGGSWYMPNIVGGVARGLVEIDLQSTEPQGRIRSFQNTTGDVQVTSLRHGLTTGDRVRITGAAGTGISGTSSFKVTVIDQDTFSLDGRSSVGQYDTSGGLATWTTNIVETATESAQGEVVITSQTHGLLTGDQIRVLGMSITRFGETLPSSGNGLFTVTKLTNDTFLLQGSTANGIHTPGSGYWVPFAEPAFDGTNIPQIVSGNTIDGNGLAGFYVDLSTGTRFDGDIVENTVSGNQAKGIHIESHSFGLGLNLPLDPNDSNAIPDARDISFNVNIGTAPTDGNDISSNQQAGIVIEALDFATGSFEINGNRINSNVTDDNSLDPFDYYKGDGIVVRLASDDLASESVALLTESIIEGNQIGVDSRGNQGNGLSFSITDRTRIQDLEINNNFFLNSGLDGFHFVRTKDASLNSVIFNGNDATNNAGDGFDIFAQNTVKNKLDFVIRNSNIDNNGEYGIRVDVQADARVDIDISGSSIRQNGSEGGGFNPDDGAGALGQSGGVGIHGFQQVSVDFRAEDVDILGNFGDGFSVDASNFFDTLTVNASFIDSNINSNTLTGLRSVGAAFGTFEFIRSDFVGNETDGARIISNIDVGDLSRRRVGGQDIDVFALGSDFQLNGASGLVLGQGVSAMLGNGDVTADFANRFGGRLGLDRTDFGPVNSTAGNGEDGLKIVQDAGTFLRERNGRRVIQTAGNVFSFNGGDGIDIGHDTRGEAGNVLHGHEVMSDTHVIVTGAEISNNLGDGLEYLADSVLRIKPEDGGGQDNIPNPDISSLLVSNSRIRNNGQRGVDILNRYNEDSRITLYQNEVIGNRFSGIYVVNTSSHDQLQSGPNDPLVAEYYNDLFYVFRTDPDGRVALNHAQRDANIELRVQDNLIESNGTAAVTSTVPVNFTDEGPGKAAALASASYHHNTDQINGTLGGLIVRVGTGGTNRDPDLGRVSYNTFAQPEEELTQAGIDAEVWRNSFDGNVGADVYFDSFASLVPRQSDGNFHLGLNPEYLWNSVGFRDPLARLDLSFRENTGNSLDVINGFAFLDNVERVFKSRTANGAPFPNADGFFPDTGLRNGTGRRRNATRTLGFLNEVGQRPGWDFVPPASEFVDGQLFLDRWSYDGWGTPTWRVESDFDFNNFDSTSNTAGLSDFFDTVNLSSDLNQGEPLFRAEEAFQWDTGVNIPGFVGATPFSLQRGDIFGVLGTDATPVLADSLDANDSFLGATPLLLDPLTGFQAPLSGFLSVNSLATNGNLNIHRKGDRDYYQFVAAGTGTLSVNVAATDSEGDFLSFLVYERNPDATTEEVPMVRAADGVTPIRTIVAPDQSGVLTVQVVAGRTYYVEVMSNEAPNTIGYVNSIEDGKSFNHGTVRSYSLSIDAPLGPTTVLAAPASTPSSQPVAPASSPGFLAPASIAGQNPRLDSISPVSPNPRSVSLNTLTLNFTEDVTGVDRTDFELTRNGVVLDTSGLLVSQLNAMTYEVTNLAELTSEAGNYEFTLIVAGSGIVDTEQAPLAVSGNETVVWVLNNTVDFFGDTTDNIPGDGAFADVNGNRSLRAAINEANVHTGTDIIQLIPGTYVLSLNERFEDDSFSGDLDIRESLVIRGTGATAADTVIDANQVDRVFHVFPGVELILENLTISGGEAYDGAGILIEGTRTTSGMSASGGGIVRMTEVNVVNNEAYNQGGGIYNLGTLDAERSSISMNEAGSRGGGIFNHGRTTLLNTTVSTNSAVSRGGGIYNEVRASAINLVAMPVVTVAELSAINTTIAFNSAGSTGGGLYQEDTSQPVIGNTILDQNTAEFSPDLFGRVNSLGNNFAGNLGVDVTRADLSLLSTDIIIDTDAGILSAGLEPLTNANANGTWVHPLTAASFAVDAGSNAVFATAAGVQDTLATLINLPDQVTSGRLVEGDNDGVFTIDMGAFEYFVSQPVAIIFATPNPAGANEVVNFDASGSTHSLVPGLSKIVLYEWDFIYDGTTFTADSSGSTAITASNIYPAEGTYTAALRVTDDTGATDIETVTIVVAAPSAPVITLPITGGTSDSTPVIAWTAGTGQFSLTVTHLGTGEVVISETGLTEKQFTPTIALAPGFYRAVVTATNLSGSESSAPHDFEVIRIAFTDPMNGDVEFDVTPEFTFTAIPDADRYQVWVSQLDPETGANIGIPINDQFIDAASALIPGTELAIYEPGTPLEEGRYRAWVRAFDADGNSGDWSLGSTFTVARPVVTGPVFATRTTVDSTPTITWTDVSANQYQVWLTQIDGTTADGTVLTAPQLILNTVVQGLEFTTPPLGNGNFRVWVRGVDDEGEAGLWSTQYNFRKDLALGPQLISPIQGVNTTDRTPVFTWEALEGATHYELWVNSSTGITRVIYNDNIPHVEGASTITFTDPSVTLTHATYRWWVRAFNEDGGQTGWSNSATFFVPIPVITQPAPVPGGVTGVSGTNLPTLAWNGVPEYVRYEVWVNNQSTGQSRVVHETDITTTTYTPELPLENGTFRFWVRGFDAEGNVSQWSNPVDFALDSTIDNAPILVSPVRFETDNTPQFEWTAVPNVTSYEILVKNMGRPEQPTVLNQTMIPDTLLNGNLAFTPANNLLPARYRWWIRGLNADGNPGPWSQPVDFNLVSNDVQEMIPSDSLIDPQPMMLASLTESSWSDDLHSITVHPAAVVVATNSTTTVTDEAAVEADVSVQAVDSAFDSVMEEMATANWLSLIADSETEVTDVAVDSSELSADRKTAAVGTTDVSEAGDRPEKRATASAFALAMASLTGRRRSRREEEK